MKKMIFAAVAAIFVAACGNQESAPAASAASAVAAASQAAPFTSEAAEKIKTNFLDGCKRSAQMDAKGKLTAQQIAKLCGCMHDELAKQYPDEAAWIEANMKIGLEQKIGAEFTQKMAKAGGVCMSKMGG